MKRFRIQLVIAAIVLVCGVSLMGMVYLVFNKPYTPINPGITVSAPSPVAAPISPVARSTRFARATYHTNYSTPSYNPMRSSSAHVGTSTRGLYLTSSARVHSVGGGGNGGHGMATTSRSSSNRGIVYSTTSVTMPQTNFLAMADTRQMAQPAAQQAPQLARLASRQAPPPPQPPGGEGGLSEENQLVEHPIGEPWILVLFAALYAVVHIMIKRRKNA